MKKILGKKQGTSNGRRALADQDVYVELNDGPPTHHRPQRRRSERERAARNRRNETEEQSTREPEEGGEAPEESFWKNVPEGYGWDFCIVVPYDASEDPALAGDLEGQSRVEHSPDHVAFTQIVERLYQAGLQTHCFRSGDGDEIYIKVRASLERLAEYAADIGWDMQLDPQQLRDKIDNADAPIEDDHETTPLTPYQHIFASFDDERPELFAHAHGYQHPFSDLLRIKMIFSIITSNDDGCARLNLRSMKSDDKDPKKCSIIGYFPLHNAQVVDDLERRWLSWKVRPWEQPLDDIKEYFGEKVALYFAFTGHYTTWLLPLAIAGLVVTADLVIEAGVYNSVDRALVAGYMIPFFCIFVSFWSQLMIEFWKRQEATKAMEWGVSAFEDEEVERPEFDFDEVKKSLINGATIKYFDPKKKSRRLLHSALVIAGMMFLVLGCVSGIFGLQYYFNSQSNAEEASNGNTATSILSAVQITILAMLYNDIAIKLTEQENHRTDTEFDDALIAKLFAFSFINSYASLFFIAFIKWNLGEQCNGPCMVELAYQLAVIFGTKLTVDKITTFATLHINKYLAARAEEAEYAAARKRGETVKPPGPIELQKRLPEYDISLDILGDYGQIFIQYGYVTLFVAACPIAPLMAYISNVIELRSDGHKLFHLHRRVVPMGAQDIGTWLLILQMTAVIAVITNAAILCFTMGLLNFSDVGKTWLFIGFQYVVFLSMALFAYLVDDVPPYVQIQLDRQEYLAERLNMTDEEMVKEKEKTAKKQARNGGIGSHASEADQGPAVTNAEAGGDVTRRRLDPSLFVIHEEDVDGARYRPPVAFNAWGAPVNNSPNNSSRGNGGGMNPIMQYR